MVNTLSEMIKDLQTLEEKHWDKEITIYCGNCDCSDSYNGAIGFDTEIVITINEG